MCSIQFFGKSHALSAALQSTKFQYISPCGREGHGKKHNGTFGDMQHAVISVAQSWQLSAIHSSGPTEHNGRLGDWETRSAEAYPVVESEIPY